MAINFYGSCKGSSASKYDVWLNVSQNSQDIINNRSNITVKFYVKRNDGYGDSAYNLNDDANSVTIKVGGTTVVSTNREIDTRNEATVLLGSWTGNVSHSSEGTLTVSVNASFAMTNNGLSSGSVSADFTCTPIQRKSTLSFSSTTVNPDSSVTATISSFGNAFTHKIIWSLGSKRRELSLAGGVLTAQLNIPLDWCGETVNSASAAISVELVTYSNLTVIGTNIYNLTFIISATDQFKPDFSVGITRIDNGVPAEWAEYVQGISKAQIKPENLTFKYGASLAAITVTVGSVSVRGNTNPTFDLNESGNLTVTVAVRDSRGFLTVKTQKITVHPYAPPSVEILKLFRCNSDGLSATYGTYLSAVYTLQFSSVNGKNQGEITIRYKTVNDENYSSEKILQSSPAVFGGNISVNNSVQVCFTVKDSVNPDGMKIVRAVSSGNIPFNIKKGGRGAAFGKFSENDNELSIGWNLDVSGDVTIGGELNCETVGVSCSELAEYLTGWVKYYPCLKACFVRLRVKAAVLLSANVTHILAHIPQKPPGMFTPINGFANYQSGGVGNAGIVYKTGDVVFRSSVDVPEGTYIYISGYYIADFNE